MAAVIHEKGAPGVLRWESVYVPAPGTAECVCSAFSVDVIELGAHGSLFLTRPAIMHYLAEREDLERSAQALFDVIAAGAVRPAVNRIYPVAACGQDSRPGSALDWRAGNGARWRASRPVPESILVQRGATRQSRPHARRGGPERGPPATRGDRPQGVSR